MSTISHSAYLSELYNLRNMVSAHSLNLQEINILLKELGENPPSGITFIDNWEDGIDADNATYSAKVIYEKVNELIKQIENMGGSSEELDTIKELIEGQTTILNQHTQTLNDHSALLQSIQKDTKYIRATLDNSVLPQLTEISDNLNKTQKLVEKNVLETTEVKGLIQDSVIPHLTTIDGKIDQILKTLISKNSEQATMKTQISEIYELVRNK